MSVKNPRADEENALIDPLANAHGCEDCGEINRGYIEVESGKKICRLCGGTALDQQESFDRILELKSELRYIHGDDDV